MTLNQGRLQQLRASAALADTIRRLSSNNIPSLVSVVRRATSQRGGSEHSPTPAEPARPSGLSRAERIGVTSAPSSTTTLLALPVAEKTVSQQVSHVNPQPYRIGTRSRTSDSSCAAAARAELELQLARAREATIIAEINALDAGASRAGSDINLITDRPSLAGLSPAAASRHAAPHHKQGAAHSPKPSEGGEVDARVNPCMRKLPTTMRRTFL